MSLSKKKDIVNAIKSTLSMSTVHSFPYLVANDSILIKFVWLISFIGSFYVCSYTIFISIQSYLQYEVISKIETKPVADFNFPMIKICSINPFVNEYAFNVLKQDLVHMGLGETSRLTQKLLLV